MKELLGKILGILAKMKAYNKITMITLISIPIIAGGAVAFISASRHPSHSDFDLRQLLLAEDTITIEIAGIIRVESQLHVNGIKTITGNGTIIMPKDAEAVNLSALDDGKSWSLNCSDLSVIDTAQMPSVLYVNPGAVLTMDDRITINGNDRVNGVSVSENGKLFMNGKPTIKNGAYHNVWVAQNASLDMDGGNITDAGSFGIINMGDINIYGGSVSASGKSAVYTSGILYMSGGNISKSKVHNIYVAGGNFFMEGGENTDAAEDGIHVADGAWAEINGGTVKDSSRHGLCNHGHMEVGTVSVIECGINNNSNAILKIDNTIVENSIGYGLSNMGGDVTANHFKVFNSDSISVQNFSGNMELNDLSISGSRDGNISSLGGKVVIKKAKLGISRDKSVTIGGGEMTMSDIVIEGTSNDKFGVYAFGGILEMKNTIIKNVNSSAIKLETGANVKLNNIDISEIEQVGIDVVSSILSGTDIKMKGLGSHALLNNNGIIELSNVTVNDVERNVIQHRGGTTTVNDLMALDIGNHGGYIVDGEVNLTNAVFLNMRSNGFFMPEEGTSVLTLDNVTIDGAGQQGINSWTSVIADGLTIENVGNNGVFNRGTAELSNVIIKNTGHHGISNVESMIGRNITISETGEDSNSVQNSGKLELNGLTASNSKNHGIYIAEGALLNGSDMTINVTAKNGIFNLGTASIDGIAINNCADQGINNTGSFTASNVKVSHTKANGIFNNRTGQMLIKGVEVSHTEGHGLNNTGGLNISDAEISASGEERNSVQNTGNLIVNNVSSVESQNHGIFNGQGAFLEGSGVTFQHSANNGIFNMGTISSLDGILIDGAGAQGINNVGYFTASNIAINDTERNGIFNTINTELGLAGEMNLNQVKIIRSGDQGINNISTLSATDINIDITDKNGIYNNGGTMTLSKVIVGAPGQHGINNSGILTISGGESVTSGEGSNNIQNSGTLLISDFIAKNSLNHGIYNNEAGSISGQNVTVAEAKQNGIFNTGLMFEFDGLTVINAGNQGINNTGTFNVNGINVSHSQENGIFNNKGTMDIKGIQITNPLQGHGINNSGNLILQDTQINGSGMNTNGEKRNNIQNTGNLAFKNLIIENSQNHGIYNGATGSIAGEGITIGNPVGNGLFNVGNVSNIKEMKLNTIGDQGINNTGTFSAEVVEISKTKKNGIYNNGGTMSLLSTSISSTGEHGISNSGTLTIKNSNILGSGIGKNNIQNSGNLKIEGLTVKNSSNHGIYLSASGTISGKNISILDAAGNGIFNDDGNVSNITGLTIKNAGIQGINNTGTFAASDITVSLTEENGIFNTAGGEMILTNIDISSAGQHGINNTNTPAVSTMTVNGGTIDGSGADRNNIQNTGILIINDLFLKNSQNHGIFNGVTGILSIDTLNIINTVNHGINNAGTISALINYTHNNLGGLPIAGSGSVTMPSEGKIEIINVTAADLNLNAFHNNVNRTIAGIEIDGFTVTVENGVQNAGNAVWNESGHLMIDGDLIIKNLHSTHDNGGDGRFSTNSNNSGNGILNSGRITVTGDVIIGNDDGSNPMPWRAINNTNASSRFDVLGDVIIYGALDQGIVIGNMSMNVEGDVLIRDVGQNGVWLNHANALLEINNDLRIEGTGNQGINNNSGGTLEARDIIIKDTAVNGLQLANSALDARNITVSNVGNRGISLNDGNSSLNVTEEIKINNPTNEALDVSGIVNAESITIDGSDGTTGTSTQGIRLRGAEASLTTTGDVIVNNSAGNGVWVDTAGRVLTVGGVLEINNVTTGVNCNSGGIVNAGSVSIDGTVGAGIQVSNVTGEINVTGTVTLQNIGGMGLTATNGVVTLGALDALYEPQAIMVNLSGGAEVTINGGTIGPAALPVSGNFNGVRVENGELKLNGVTIRNIRDNALSVGANGKITVDSISVTGGRGSVWMNGVNAEIIFKGNNEFKNVLAQDSDQRYVINMNNASSKITLVDNAELNIIFEDTQNRLRGGINVQAVGASLNAAPTSKINIEYHANAHGSQNPIGVNNFSNLNVNSELGILIINYDAGRHGEGLVMNDCTMTIIALEIINPFAHGLQLTNATLDAESIKVVSAGARGISLNDSSSNLTVTGNIIVSNSGSDSIYNYGGTMLIDDVLISQAGRHGVNNYGIITINGGIIDGSAATGSNIRNTGTLTINNLFLKNSENHGIYNESSGILSVDTLNITDTVIHGIYNAGTITSLIDYTHSALGGVPLYEPGQSIPVVSKIEIINETAAQPNLNAFYNDTTRIIEGIEIDGFTVTVENGVQNAGNAVWNESGHLTIDGDLIIKNLYSTHDNSGDGRFNTNGNTSGNGILNSGRITVTGDVIIGNTDGSNPMPWRAVSNTNDSSGFDVLGDVIIYGALDQGIVIGDMSMNVEGDVLIRDVGQNGVWLNHANAELEVDNELIIEGTGNHGLNNAGGTVNAGSINIDGTSGAGIQVSNAASEINVSGSVTLDNIDGMGLTVANGTVTLGALNASYEPQAIFVNVSGGAEVTINGGMIGPATLPLSPAVSAVRVVNSTVNLKDVTIRNNNNNALDLGDNAIVTAEEISINNGRRALWMSGSGPKAVFKGSNNFENMLATNNNDNYVVQLGGTAPAIEMEANADVNITFANTHNLSLRGGININTAGAVFNAHPTGEINISYGLGTTASMPSGINGINNLSALSQLGSISINYANDRPGAGLVFNNGQTFNVADITLNNIANEQRGINIIGNSILNANDITVTNFDNQPAIDTWNGMGKINANNITISNGNARGMRVVAGSSITATGTVTIENITGGNWIDANNGAIELSTLYAGDGAANNVINVSNNGSVKVNGGEIGPALSSTTVATVQLADTGGTVELSNVKILNPGENAIHTGNNSIVIANNLTVEGARRALWISGTNANVTLSGTSNFSNMFTTNNESYSIVLNSNTATLNLAENATVNIINNTSNSTSATRGGINIAAAVAGTNAAKLIAHPTSEINIVFGSAVTGTLRGLNQHDRLHADSQFGTFKVDYQGIRGPGLALTNQTLTATDIELNNASGQGLQLNSAATLNARNIKVNNAETRGISLNNNNSTLNVSGNIEINNPTAEALDVSGTLNAGSITIDGSNGVSGTSTQGLRMRGANASVTVTGDISISNSAGNGAWLDTAGRVLTVGGDLNINNAVTGINNNTGGTINAGNINVENTSQRGVSLSANAILNVSGTIKTNTTGQNGLMVNAGKLKADIVDVRMTASEQGLQVQNSSEFDVRYVYIGDVQVGNAFRIFNDTADPSIKIETLVVNGVLDESAVQIQKNWQNILPANLSIGNMYFKNTSRRTNEHSRLNVMVPFANQHNHLPEESASLGGTCSCLYNVTSWDTSGMSEATVMSYNIYNGNISARAANIFNLIQSNAPDAIALQEVDPTWAPLIKSFIASNGYSAYGRGRNGAMFDAASYSGGEEFALILWKDAKYDLIDSGYFSMPNGNEPFNRIANWVKLEDKVSGDEIVYLSTHLSSGEDNSAARADSSVVMINQMQQFYDDETPIIIMGDFNTQYDSNSYRLMQQNGYNDVRFIAQTTTSSGTFNGAFTPGSERAWGYHSHLDHMFASFGVVVTSFNVIDHRVGGVHISDHHPLFANIFYSGSSFSGMSILSAMIDLDEELLLDEDELEEEEDELEEEEDELEEEEDDEPDDSVEGSHEEDDDTDGILLVGMGLNLKQNLLRKEEDDFE